MKSIVARVEVLALAMGGPGLFVVALLDSSFLSLPQINDLLVIWMVIKQPHLMAYYAAMATLGSVAGCLVLYYLARRGGEALLRKRFQAGALDRATKLFQRYGVLAVLVPALLPPPAPFKLFVLLAGVARLSPLQFILSIVVGRGARYFGEGLLAVWYGEWAIDFLRDHGRQLSLVLAVVTAVAGIVYVVWRSRRDRHTPVPGLVGEPDEVIR